MPDVRDGEACWLGGLIRLFVITGLLLLAPGVQPALLAQMQADPAGYATSLERLERTMELVARLQAGLDRTLFDLDALSHELAFEEPEGLQAWVSTNISFQPYRGVLRGAEGTLISGAGNSFDQALLLSRLVSGAGYDTRIVIGELGPEEAEQLLLSAAPAPDSGEWREAALALLTDLQDDQSADDSYLAAIVVTLKQLLEPVQVDEELYVRAGLAAEQLSSVLGESGIDVGGATGHAALLEAAAEYAWLEYRLGENSEWTPLPAALPDGVALPEAHTVLAEAVPAEYVHRLRIEAFAESRQGDDFRVAPVISRWEQPTADLNGRLVSYVNVPSALGELGSEASIGELLEASDFFIPYLDDRMAAGAQAFDLEGNLLDPVLAGSDFAGVFRNVQGGFLDAIGALSGLGFGSPDEDPEPALALTSFWLEYTLIGPGEVEQVHRRELFDLIGADERAAGGSALRGDSRAEAELSLLREDRLMAITGNYRPDWLLNEFFERFLNTRTFLEYALALQYGIQPEVELEQAIDSASPLEHLLTAQQFDAAAQRGGGSSWRSEPTLLVFGSGLSGTREDATVVNSIDIVSNARVSLSASGDFSGADSLLLGVWETFVESDIHVAQAGEAGLERYSAAELLAAPGEDLVVLEPGADARAFGFNGVAAVNASRDLAAGYHLVLPADGAAAEQPAWWRVDAATGETLGVTFDGRGQSLTEYSIKLYDNAFTLVFAVKGLTDCMDGYSSGSPAQACCLLKAHLNNVVGLGIGMHISNALASLVVTMASGLIPNVDPIGRVTGLDCKAFS